MPAYRPMNCPLRISILAIVLCVQPIVALAVDNSRERLGRPSGHFSVAPPEPRPADKVPQKGTWPFAPWSYAKAYTFNFFHMRDAPRPIRMTVVGGNGEFSPHIRSEHLISVDDALSAANLVAETNGSFVTAKCNFPRHAVVLFDKNDKPVASANVCFECDGAIMWPDYKKDDDEELSEDEWEARMNQYEAAIAKWKTLFGAKLGLPIDYGGARD